MQTFVAFLRGINVGGHNKIPMQDLRQLLDGLSFKDVKTYIQTGNIVFKAKETDRPVLETKIKAAIKNQFNLEIPVLIKTPKEIQTILTRCPFTEAEKENSYFALLFNKATKQQAQSLDSYSFPNEKFKLINDCIYLYSSTGYGRAKANNNFFEKKLLMEATTRNYKTLKKLIDLSDL
ncbi:DUF1697 domain-containing protein [Olleya aquimaris]|uniref:Uncharacterized protein (DUF1697 family) n=1 Tax=Olleya aquimaris TaxID=639310 RepID=A0A327RDQ5_9FLAO|nr:DUF1697 domain-containing protein [Olleya aquimaris]RAJ15136.1 uncharacterized protein (DUF1697 family) [Olleya aquimaris]